jgi:uncharacterized protein (TIGR02145 family)
MPPFRLLILLYAASIPSLLSAQSTSPCNWNPDYDGDNTIGVNDLLALLGVFEEVDSDADGIFDSQDDCVGIYDACGICDGPGATFPIIDEIIYVTDSVFLPPVGSWYVFTYAVDTIYTYVCPVEGCTNSVASNFNPLAVIEDGSCLLGPAQCGGQSSITFDGDTYNLVGIGTQCWFKENLRSDIYRNGDPIPGDLSDDEWSNATSGAQAASNVYSHTIYGRYYNWFATQDTRGLCPMGFHVPSDAEWMTLEMELGMTEAQAHSSGWRGTDQGLQMKSSPNDSPSWNGSNTSGFSGVYAGYRHDGGEFGGQCWWWSATTAIYRTLDSGFSTVDRFSGNPANGFSIRCIKD